MWRLPALRQRYRRCSTDVKALFKELRSAREARELARLALELSSKPLTQRQQALLAWRLEEKEWFSREVCQVVLRHLLEPSKRPFAWFSELLSSVSMGFRGRSGRSLGL